MTVSVIVVGRVRPPLAQAVAEYETRARRYWKLSVVEVDAGTGRGGPPDPDEVRAQEGGRILAHVPEGAELWALTRKGRGISSDGLARLLGERQLHGGPSVALAIGGAFGLPDAVLARSARRVSLSSMTLPHEMSRLIVMEQLYRAGTILRGEPYHKGGEG